jgi:hypothetical protein
MKIFKYMSAPREAGRIMLNSFLVGFLVLQMLFGTFSSSIIEAQAQIIKDPINTNSPAPAPNVPQYVGFGVEDSIRQYLCAPSGNATGTELFDCVTKIYRFGIAFGAIALVFFVVFAGYMYMAGGETGKTKGKSILFSAITGMAIILSSFVLLKFINPDLVKIKSIQPPIFTANNIPKCEEVGLGVNCVLPNGQIRVSGNGGGVPGSANEAQYKDLISKYATQNGLDYCALSALIQKESTFNTLIVSNPPPNTVNTSAGSPPSYNVSFASTGHGIGLGQVYIYPGQSSRPGGEFGFTKALTVQDLIVPDTGIRAGAYFFGKLVKERKNNLREAYDDYQAGRGGNSDPSTLDKYIQIYNACKLRGS